MRRKHFLASWLVLLALAVQAFAAPQGKVYWVANAAPVAQVTTFTIGESGSGWVAGNAATITVNNKPCTVTLGSVSTSITDVAAALAAALNSGDSSTTDLDIISDETKNIGGQQIAEFRAFTAEATGPVVTITGTRDGIPFVAVSSETAAEGTISDATPTEATGPNHFDNAANWDTGIVPYQGDDIIFDAGSSEDVLYWSTAISPTDPNHPQSVTVEPGYRGNIGLPLNNAAGYREYLARFVPLEFDTAGDIYRLAGSGRCQLNIQGTAGVVHVESGQVSLMTTSGVITLNALGGNIKLGDDGAAACVLGTMNVGDEQGKRSTVDIAQSCTFSTPVLTIFEGNVTLDAAIAATTTLYKGTLTVNGGAQTTIDVRGGNLIYNGTGTITTLTVYSGGADFSQDLRSKTVTNMVIYKGTSLWNQRGSATFTNNVDLVDCGLHEVDWKTIKARTWTPSGL